MENRVGLVATSRNPTKSNIFLKIRRMKMKAEVKLAITKDRLNKIKNSGKSTGGVERKLERQIRRGSAMGTQS